MLLPEDAGLPNRDLVQVAVDCLFARRKRPTDTAIVALSLFLRARNGRPV